MDNHTNQSVAIVGMAFRLPGDLSTADALWNALINSENLITEVGDARFSTKKYLHTRKSELSKSYTFKSGLLSRIDEFDAGFFNISPREAYQMDPQQRLLLELTWEALENGNQNPQQLAGSDCAVFIGIANTEHMFKSNNDCTTDSYTMLGNCPSIAANRISYVFDLHGPSLSIDTACSSSMVALHHACKSIRSGEVSSAIVGGVNFLLSPAAFVGFSKAMMLSPDGACKSFDKDANGYVRAEGGIVFYLKPLEAAIKNGDPIHGVILNTGVNSDGHTNGIALPSATAQAALMTQVHSQIGLSADDISYVEAHGTGTPVGDPIEALAIGNAIGKKRAADNPLFIGSIKSNIGHLEVVSGLAGILKSLLCFKHKMIPATNHFKTPNPHIDFEGLNLSVVDRSLDLPKPNQPQKYTTIAVNSFGFGGTNAHVVLSEYVAPCVQTTIPFIPPLLLSARNDASFQILASQYLQLLHKNPENYYDIAYTLARRRPLHDKNVMIQGDQLQNILDGLEQIKNGDLRSSNLIEGKHIGTQLSVALVYSGNGSQWQGMGKALIEQEPLFEKTIMEIDLLFSKYADFSIKEALLAAPENSHYQLTEVAQPCLFALQVAMTQYLLSQGVVITAVVGHSVGEVCAAWVCGALTLEQAVQVIYTRSFWQGKTRGHGKMAAIALSEKTVEAMLLDHNLSDALEISAINSPKGITLSGELSALEKLKSICDEKNIFCMILDLDYAFHSKYMDPLEHDVISALETLVPHNNRICYMSTVEGKSLEGKQLNAAYWWRNIRQPVMLQSAIDALITDGIQLFIEVGPHPVLKRYLDDSLLARDIKGLVVPTMKRQVGTREEIDSAVFKIWMGGANMNWDRWFPAIGNYIALPAYPWIKEKYWLKATDENTDQSCLTIEHPLLGYRIKIGEPTWENHLDATVVSYLADHVVSGLPVMPAAGYAEMALAVAKIWYHAQSYDVRDLEILAPMVFDNTVCKIVRFSLQPEEGTFQIKSRPRHSDEAWSVNATGRILGEPTYAPKKKVKVVFRELKSTADTLDKEKFYARGQSFGLSYGPTFQSIEKCFVKNALALATVKFHPDLLPSLEHYSLHPALLDACFQLLIGYQNKKQDMLLPVRMGRLKIVGKLYGALQITAQITKRNKQSVLANFSIINKDNVIVAEITDCRFKNVYLDKQLGSCKNIVCKPHLLPINHSLHANVDKLQLIRDQAEKMISKVTKSSDHFRVTMPLIDLMISQFAYVAIKAEVSEKADFSFEEMCALGKIVKTQHPLLQHCLNILVEDNYLQQGEDNRYRLVPDQEEMIDPMVTWHALLRDYPNYISELVMVGRCGFHLKDILCGKIKPEKIFQPTDKNSAIVAEELEILTCAVKSLLKKWPIAKRRLRILAITDAPGNLINGLLTLLPDNKVDFCLAAIDDQALIKAKNITENYPFVKAIPLNLNAPFAEQSALSEQHFDLIIIQNGLHHCANSEKTLRELQKISVADSTVLIQENYADRMQAFVTAVTSPDEKETYFSPAHCERLLTQSGYSVTAPFYEPGADDFEGAFVIMAQPAHAEESEPHYEDGEWLILTDNADAVSPLLTALKAKQSHVVVATSDVNTLLAKSAEKHIQLHIVLCMGMQANAQGTVENPLYEVQNHCDFMIDLVKAIHQLTWHAYPQLTLVTQGGALCDEEATCLLTSNPNHAALWGFGRVLMNEHPELQCRLIDLQGDALKKLSKQVVDALLHVNRDNEMIVTASAFYGLRATSLDTLSSLKKQHKDFRLDFSRPGPLKNLQWFPVEKSQLADDEVAVKPLASGLNFRDVMYSMGLIPDEAVEDGFLGQTLGMEFAGEILAIGNAVSDFAVGDKVMGFAPASFSSYAVTKAYAVTPLPREWRYSAGASIPIAFFTAYYALTHLARIEPGERLLIHGAAGGVGIAAIQLAQHLGVEIYATAGSDEKRDFLTLLGVKHIYNSRGLAFADQIIEHTKGEGVDVVLNCLAGEAIPANLSIMKPFGRFLELGKRDFYANSKIGLRPFRNNISYFGIDADQLIVKNPLLSKKLFKEMFHLFDQGVLFPLPYKEFSADNIHDAFRYMQQSRHIGKIIVNFTEPPLANFASVKNDKTLTLNANATYLVTGGLNGFGFRTAQWLVEKGARHLVLLSRSGVPSDTIQSDIAELVNQGVEVQVKALDITDKAALDHLLLEIAEKMPPLKGIFHAAAVYEDAIITNLTSEKMHQVLAPKLLGAWHLHQATLTQSLSLDYFVVYSSVATLLGNPGQANYVAANAFLENLVRMRCAMNMAGFFVAWGPIDDVGYLARNAEIKQSLTAKMGMPVLTSSQALAALEPLLMEKSIHGVVISDLNTKTLKRLTAAGSTKFELLFSHHDDSDMQHDEMQMDIRQQIADGTLTEGAVVDMLTHEIGKILCMTPEKIDIHESLLNMGMDSLMGVELANAIEQSFGVSIPILALSQDPTIDKLAKRLFSQLAKAEPIAESNKDLEVQAILKISERHGEQLTEEEIASLLKADQVVEV